jgi:YD repeat-containing protein
MSIVKATAYNKSAVYCDESLLQDCTSVSSLPTSVQFAYDRTNSNVDVTGPGGDTLRLHFVRNALYAYLDLMTVEKIGVTGSLRSYTYDHDEPMNGAPKHIVNGATVGGQLWQYDHGVYPIPGPDNTGPYTTSETVLGPLSYYASIGGDLETRRLTGVGTTFNSVSQTINSYRSISSITQTELNKFGMSYDARNNRTEVRETAKPSSPLAQRFSQQHFPATCASIKTCNQPDYVVDARSNRADFTYSTDHGGVLTATQPPDINGIRPQTRYEYVQRYARVLNSSGSYVAATAPIWLLARTRMCKTTSASGSSCAGGASDEVIVNYDYGPDSGANNLLLRGVVRTTTTDTLRTCYGYDANGNRISETQPKAALSSCP